LKKVTALQALKEKANEGFEERARVRFEAKEEKRKKNQERKPQGRRGGARKGDGRLLRKRARNNVRGRNEGENQKYIGK